MSTMTPSQIELARKLVGHERWDAKKFQYGWNAYTLVCQNGASAATDPVSMYPGQTPLLPDLTDDATAGVLLGMWREAEGLGEADALIVLSRLLHSAPLDSASASTHMAELLALMLLDAWATK